MQSSETTLDVAVDGGTLRAWRSGDGPPLVHLHGGPGLCEYSDAAFLAELAGYTIYRFQQRGLEPSLIDGPFTVERHVADVLAVIDATGADRVWLTGHSWGGYLAMWVAARHPERLLGFVSIDPLGALGDGGAPAMSQALGARLTPEAAARAGGITDPVEGLALVWPGYFADPASAPPMPPMRISQACHDGTWASIHDHAGRATLAALLPGVRLPAAFVLGGASPMPPSAGQASARLIPGARVFVEDGCGHLPWLERPGVVAAGLAALADS